MGPGQLGPGQSGPGQLGPGAQLSTFSKGTVGPRGLRDVFRIKNGIMWEKFPRGQAPPPSPSMGIFSTECRFFSEDVPKNFFLKIKFVF